MNEQPVVMVVEDDPQINALECELLAVHGFRCVPAYTGAEAIDAARHCEADAVVMDVMLPEMDGFETCRALRSNKNGSLPIVMVTTMDSDDYRRRGFDAGADAYFTKPLNPDKVISTLRRLIEQTNGNGES